MNIKIFLLLFVFSCCIIVSHVSAEDILNEFRNLNLEASITYPEVDDIKQNILIMLYTMERKDLSQDTITFVSQTRDFLVKFNEIYLANKRGDLKAKETAIKDCANLRAKIPKNPRYIEEINAVEGTNALINKFICDNALFFENIGNNESATRKKISYYKNATYAYTVCGEVILGTSLKILTDKIEKKYNEDMAKAEGLVNRGLSELDLNITVENVENASMSKKIDAIVKFSSARGKFGDAIAIYKSHNEDELANMCKEKIDEIDKIMPILQSSVFGFLFVISLSFFLVVTYLFLRINEWKEAMYDVSLGDEILGKV